MNGRANGHVTNTTQSYDVIIVGAGISGVNAGYRMQTTLPNSSYTILEGRADLGGTWNLFKYPGIRSDSDLHTFGFPFNPWTKENPIATGESICTYMKETASKFGIDQHFQFKHKVVSADWSSDAQLWRLEVDNEGTRKIFYAKFIIMGTGYYSYEKPLKAHIPGLEKFKGTTVHPQFWPEDLDYKGKKMVVIGSGATAITLLPALVEGGVGHVTMLQRSPSYVMSQPQRKTGVVNFYERFLPTWISLRITRIRFLVLPYLFYLFCRRWPDKARALLMGEAQKQLPKDFPMDPHFTPTYNPWDQRLCLCPDGDFFKCFANGRAQVVTSTIDTVTSDSILLSNGEKLDADIIVTATGLNLQFCGNISLSVDKQPVAVPSRFMWRATMLSGVPNLFLIIGYVNASWTLGADSASRLLTRLMGFMAKNKYTSATPRISEEEAKEKRLPLNLTSTYVKSGVGNMPHAGAKAPWLPRDNYMRDSWFADRGDLRLGLEFVGKSS
ncbi:FAD/NAD(P)-binding domain-containing protein [Lindgomyces ingoldianus]|uniref:FAD/NAD(P)-binding domain-containing protein n=1 Tax=Lindgomyces ingoldianus TaxID=673940 RepID=A0ACB6QXR2_9PLEO|nr:FAD/NAD(P)-binding domain-containing protein [Lindgomyces ingoldianus]KAF2471706.1 FAD/NAD(P)-binding domain-containing protein [Lindgomyces ingoldianus]